VYDYNWHHMPPYMRECGLRRNATTRWPCSYPCSRQWCLWPPSPYSTSCPLTLPKWVLWEKWLLGSRSEQSSVHVLRLLARGSATLFLGWWMAEPI
jgi:hypothetical protein